MQGNLFESGELLKQAGISQAIQSAERRTPGWNDLAYQLLLDYLKIQDGVFMAEDFRSWCAMEDGFPFPPSARAFGGIINRAAKEGIIEKVGHGTVTNPKAHKCFASKWRRKG